MQALCWGRDNVRIEEDIMSDEKNTREVPLHRIKPLHIHGKLLKIGHYTDEEANYKLAQAIAEEFTLKLLEFHKIKIGRDEHGNATYDVMLEIIVPETPPEHLSSKIENEDGQ
jgi:hypothetical protein